MVDSGLLHFAKGEVMMKISLATLVVAMAGLSLTAGAQSPDKAKKGGAVFVPAADIKWSDVPGMAGVQIAPVEGDPAKGPSHFFIKFAGGFTAPVHHHTANHFVTVVSGTLILTVDGNEEKLPPGSFFAFSKKTKHATSCAAGADCVLSLDARGKWDVIPEGEKSARK
jgi:quercetin dioxygenase-like cupin family protein